MLTALREDKDSQGDPQVIINKYRDASIRPEENWGNVKNPGPTLRALPNEWTN